MVHMLTLEERFWAKVALPDETGCLRWTGAKIHDGYGRLRVGTKTLRAHRVSYELLVGPIPAGLQLDHLCRVRDCVRPDHLEPVTNQENTRRTACLITHCPQGHPYSPENTRHNRAGGRYCLACKRDKSRRFRANKKGRSDASDQ